MNIPPSSEEDEEQNEPPPLLEEDDDDNKQPQLSELEDRLINNMRNIFCDNMGRIHEEVPVFPANHFSASSNDDLNFDEISNGNNYFFFLKKLLLLFNNDT